MLTNVLPVGSRNRSLAFSSAAVLVALIYVQLVLPGTPGGGRGTPMAILFNGVVTGCSAAITALGLVLVYRSLRIVNLAQAAMGAIGGRCSSSSCSSRRFPSRGTALSLAVGVFRRSRVRYRVGPASSRRRAWCSRR